MRYLLFILELRRFRHQQRSWISIVPFLRVARQILRTDFGTTIFPDRLCITLFVRSNQMTRYLIGAAAALLLSASPLLAADTMKPSNQPAGGNAAGSDTSSGAKEQSSAPPGSPAESDLSNKSSTGTGGDTSKGAKEQSSAPPGSAAATGQPSQSSDDTSNSSPGTMKPTQP
jgi:hypothetical protein